MRKRTRIDKISRALEEAIEDLKMVTDETNFDLEVFQSDKEIFSLYLLCQNYCELVEKWRTKDDRNK